MWKKPEIAGAAGIQDSLRWPAATDADTATPANQSEPLKHY